MIDTSAATFHEIQLSSAQINLLVDALIDRAELLRADGTPTPELNALVDALDSHINSDFHEQD